ncbi:MAG: hypothetical protein AB7P02_04055 [Alphaproteobacteria bacterium]
MTAATVAHPHRLAAWIAAGVLAAWAGGFALMLHAGALPPEGAGTVLALFPPGFGDVETLAAVAAADGRLVRGTWLPNLVLVDDAAAGFVGRLRAAGALAAYTPFDLGPAFVGGCAGVPPPR